jgi:alkylation response protein AidB-like acyl-CoA dehydrogenase
VLGGCELTPAQQVDFFARISYINPTAGWLAFNQSGVLGLICASLPEEGLEKLFFFNPCPLIAAVSAPTGKSERVEGGYRVSGRWAYASGVTCADAVFLLTICSDPPAPVGVLIPTGEIEIHDDWNVAALQGTGSVDVIVEDVFVPDMLTCTPFTQVRGGPQYSRLGYQAYVGGENFGFTLGVAQRMVDEIAKLSLTKKRPLAPSPVSDRGAFQQELGRTDASLRAARAYLMDELDLAYHLAEKADGPLPAPALARAGAAVSWSTETAIQACTRLFPYAGAGALHLSNPIQRSYRDLIGSGQHLVATNEALDAWGLALLEHAQ